MTPTISVIILTHNRARMLADCLQALRMQTRPPDEIVVVDNQCTDSTRQMLEDHARGGAAAAGQPPLPLRVVEGPTEGGWAASRNIGVRSATADWVAFTDDDCLPAPDWLARIETLADKHYDAVGGLVEPAERLPYPWWWHPDMGWAVGISVPGHRGPLAGSVYYPQTANWAARRSVLIAEPFQEIAASFSADGNIYRAGREDAELWRRLRRNGYRTIFDPRLTVRHRISPSRLHLREVTARAFQDGVALQRREPTRELLPGAADTLVGLPGELLLDIWKGPRHAWQEAAWRFVWALRQWGQFVEFRRREGPLKAAWFLGWYGARCAKRRTTGFLKRVARQTGIACLRLKRGRTATSYARAITVAVSGYLGDMVLLHPLIAELKAQRPEVSITLLTRRNGEALYAHDPAVSQVVLLNAEGTTNAATQDIIRSALRTSRADLILVPYFHEISPAALFSRSSARVITFTDQVGLDRQWWYDRADAQLPKPVGQPEATNLFRMFHEAGLRPPLTKAPLAFLPDEVNQMTDFLRARGLDRFNLVFLAPGTTKEKIEKLWPEERWAEVVRYLHKEYELEIAMAPGPGEEDMCARIAELSGCKIHTWHGMDIRQLALVLGETRLVVGCDNGAKHLAAAMEAPTLTLFGPTDERQWGATLDPQHHGVVRGCVWDLTEEERIGLPVNHQMLAISTEQVFRALDEMLGERS